MDEFVAYIVERCEEPRVRASLRRGVGQRPETAFRSHAYVARWVSPNNAIDERTQSYKAKEWAYYAVAAMIAAQPGNARRDQEPDSEPTDTDKPATPTSADAPQSPQAQTITDAAPGEVNVHRRRPSLGVSLAMATAPGDTDTRIIARDTAEKRLHLLTRQGLDGVHRHLPATIRHLRSARVAIDWAVLLRDLSRWTTTRDDVAKSWLQDFYRAEYDNFQRSRSTQS
jgi:CRISPR system Cascade subunit CasB